MNLALRAVLGQWALGSKYCGDSGRLVNKHIITDSESATTLSSFLVT